MNQDLLKRIANKYAGAEAAKLIDILIGKQNVNEFNIAKKLNLTINQTRNVLYKLADSGLVSFIRKKDKKKGGWYIYFWTLDEEKCLSKFKEDLVSEKNSIQEQVHNRKVRQYYFCELCELEFNEEEALVHNYMCPECGEVMQLREAEDLIGDLSKRSEEIDKVLEQVDAELAGVHKKGDRVRAKRVREEQKKKQEEREKRKAERLKEKKKKPAKDTKAKKAAPVKSKKKSTSKRK